MLSTSGAVILDDKGRGKLKATTQLQSFSLFVTAEPYSAVRQPSEMLILENDLRKDTKGKIFPVNDYKLMTRTQYQKLGNPLALSMDLSMFRWSSMKPAMPWASRSHAQPISTRVSFTPKPPAG